MKHMVTRLRHEPRLRLLRVASVEALTPGMVRVVLAGDDLDGFLSAAHDDHVKLFFPHAGEDKPVMPVFGPNGPVFPDGAVKPVARDYTPRRHDAVARTLTVDFALHAEGPASEWARNARPGQYLGVGGPRGSLVVSDDFDWYLLAGDETALPAIARRLEELPAGARALAIVEVADKAEEQPIAARAAADVLWLHRDGAMPGEPGRLLDALSQLALPSGEGYAWVAAESDVAKALRHHLVETRGIRKDRVKAAGYWRRGFIAVHETHGD
jgi:NADPH-dependent ferric siderophore reductase